jgi:hypothetical protein
MCHRRRYPCQTARKMAWSWRPQRLMVPLDMLNTGNDQPPAMMAVPLYMSRCANVMCSAQVNAGCGLNIRFRRETMLAVKVDEAL